MMDARTCSCGRRIPAGAKATTTVSEIDGVIVLSVRCGFYPNEPCPYPKASGLPAELLREVENTELARYEAHGAACAEHGRRWCCDVKCVGIRQAELGGLK